MRNNQKHQIQLTIGQYLHEVIENRKIYKPNDKYDLFIVPNEVNLIKQKNQTEGAFFKLVLEAYIKSMYDKLENLVRLPNDKEYTIQVDRTLKRFVFKLKRHYKKSELSCDWELNFYMPRYGIDVVRQNVAQRKLLKQNQSNELPVKPVKSDMKKIIALAYYPSDTLHPLNKTNFYDLASFNKWCESKEIKHQEIRLLTIKKAKCIDDIVINADFAVQHLKTIYLK
jgi:hypothetical protein